MYMYMNFTAQNIDAWVQVFAPCVGPTLRVHVHHQNDQANFTSLVCTAFLLSVVCYAVQERQKAFRSGSPHNALHCLVGDGREFQRRVLVKSGEIVPGRRAALRMQSERVN